jgi:regulatory protein
VTTDAEDRSSGPSIAGEQAGGSAYTADVHAGVEAWLASHGASVPSATSADPAAHQRRGRSGAEDLPPEDAATLGPDADPEAVARKILLDQLTGQARSRSELATKLAKKGVPGDVAERLLTRFEEVGLIDDDAFARAWVQSRQPGKGLARRALAQELRRKGIDDEVAREALDEVDPDDEVEAARVLVRRKMRTAARLDRNTALRRLTGMLARKGYSGGVAFRVVREELDAAGHDTGDLGEAD